MRHFFCVIRIGEPALRGCGKPSLIGSHARNRPRHQGAARAIVAQSQRSGSDHFANQKRTTIFDSGTTLNGFWINACIPAFPGFWK